MSDVLTQEWTGTPTNFQLSGASKRDKLLLAVFSSTVLCTGFLGTATYAPVVGVPRVITNAFGTRTPASVAALTVKAVTADGDAATAVLSDQQELLWVKERSGLTWDQLGRVFGVSRRAVHLWANGGRISEHNAVLLREFAAVVRGIPMTSPEDVRAHLLAVRGDGTSLLGGFRRRHVETPGKGVGAAFAIDELMGALHNSDVRVD